MSSRQDIDAAEARRRRIAGETLEVRVERSELAQKAASIRPAVDGRYSSSSPPAATFIGRTGDGKPFQCAEHKTLLEASKSIAQELTHEDIFDALDKWLRSKVYYREFKVRPIDRGCVCALYQSGNPVGDGLGQHVDSAIENALRKVGAL